ncbi:MAG: ribonuclease HIII [Puniceicoccales bacterium]|jgi:ribonuclease HIII|nr:ribonuclease HIII [Puniceicoccales bacterium]
MNKTRGGEPSCFTLELNKIQAEKLKSICIARGFERYDVNYADYAFRGNGFNLVMYRSGKLVLQGKEAADFLTFTIEPQVTLEFILGNESVHHPEWFRPHAGLDESGKGDFFGPVVTACVIAGEKEVHALREAGIRDSKLVSGDGKIFEMEKQMRAIGGVVVETMVLPMDKYNELYHRFGSNLNRLLGWMHACSLANALRRRYVSEGLLDRFSKQPLVQNFLKRDFPDFVLSMRTKAESDPVVAAASVAARAEYVRRMKALSDDAKMILPKGVNKTVIEVGRAIFARDGAEGLARYSKVHFKTFKEICENKEEIS